MTFTADYPEAEVLEARNYGYSTPNDPKAWVLHTSEGFNTARYFHTTDRPASTHYVVEQSGKVWQCVPESAGAYANAVEGKPYPSWANPAINLNLQTIGVEIEGHAATITQTMPRGSAQWNALIKLMAHRCKVLGIPPENTIGHYQVSVNRSDPGALDIPQVVADVKAAMAPPEQEDVDMILIQAGGSIALVAGPYKYAIPIEQVVAYQHAGMVIKELSQTDFDAIPSAPTATPSAGGLSLPLKIKGEITQ